MPVADSDFKNAQKGKSCKGFVVSVMRKNCLCGRSLTMSVAQSTPVATTSLLPPLKVPCINGIIRLCQVCLSIHPRDADAAITGSRFASLGDAPFCRGSVNIEHWRPWHTDTVLIFASDGQLELLPSCRLVYVDATCRVVPSLFYQLFSMIHGLRPPAHRSFPVLYAVRARKNCTVSRRLWKAACINTTINYCINKLKILHVKYTIWIRIHAFSRVFQSPVLVPLTTSIRQNQRRLVNFNISLG